MSAPYTVAEAAKQLGMNEWELLAFDQTLAADTLINDLELAVIRDALVIAACETETPGGYRFTTPCPDFCHIEPAHAPADEIDITRGPMRTHGDHVFGEYFYGYANEYADAPGELEYHVGLFGIPSSFRNPELLRSLAAQVTAAADWLEAVDFADS